MTRDEKIRKIMDFEEEGLVPEDLLEYWKDVRKEELLAKSDDKLNEYFEEYSLSDCPNCGTSCDCGT